MQQVCKKDFFPCWYFIGCSFPAGESQGLFPAGASQIPTLKLYHGNQTKQSVSEKMTFKIQDGGCGGDLEFPIDTVLVIFRSRGHPDATVCFNSTFPTLWEEKSKIVFQDDCFGGHF